MAGKRSATPEMPDNVATMMPVGQGVEVPPANLDHLKNVTDTQSPLVLDVDNNAIKAPESPVTPESPKPVEQPRNIPDKLKGKSPEEIANMYVNLEQEVGKHRNEVGNMRRWVDQLLTAQPQQRQPQTGPDPEEAKKQDLQELELMLSSPTKFKHKIREELIGELTNIGKQSALEQTKARAADVLSDPEFSGWLVSNVSRDLVERADGDPALFNFIVNQFKSRPQRIENIPTPGPATGTGSPGKPGGKKTFSRSEMMQLFMNNPTEYRRLAGEYQQAILDKRVTP